MHNTEDNNSLAQLREENTELHRICIRQRESLAAQQEAIAQLNMQVDGILACLCEKYGLADMREDGSVQLRMSFPADRFPDVLTRLQVSAALEDGEYVITVTAKTQGQDGIAHV